MDQVTDPPVIESAGFDVAIQSLEDLHGFYGESLGLRCVVDGRDHLQVDVGPARLSFLGVDHGRPFHHFALLVSAGRFSAAADWLSDTADLLSKAGEIETIFAFDSWDARACYALDPAGNVLELIAHNCTGIADQPGRFSGDELLGISEVGLVVSHRQDAVRGLAAAGLRCWAGELGRPGRLVFIGRQANTLILSPPGRAWLPTELAAGLYGCTTVIRAGQRIQISVADGVLSLHTSVGQASTVGPA
ncbi:MAG: VOC family protein [Solirubrobacteraceae bacterium]